MDGETAASDEPCRLGPRCNHKFGHEGPGCYIERRVTNGDNDALSNALRVYKAQKRCRDEPGDAHEGADFEDGIRLKGQEREQHIDDKGCEAACCDEGVGRIVGQARWQEHGVLLAVSKR